MPTPPMLRMRGGPYQHLLTGLNLMMARMEAEADDPDLDPLPRIREHYGGCVCVGGWVGGCR